MKSLLERQLDLILENNSTQVPDDPYQVAMTITTDLEEARRKVSELERQLMYAMDRLCGGLAMGIRKHQPGLHVALDNGSCKVGYKTKHLNMRPDLVKKLWAVDGSDPRFARRFMRRHSPCTNLSSDVGQIAQAIADFFVGHYRTLGESISGKGLIMVGGKHVSTGDLLCRIERYDEILTESRK